ncbi:MAG: carbon-nitrogen hydrolase family protein [Myxococcales bacterium]|nr:carbon-nitrogen hydrolase family protein [Myxococcales bacterium]
MGVRVGAVQQNSQEDVRANLLRTGELVARAVGQGARLVLLPENFAFMGDEAGKRGIAEELAGGGPIVSTLRELAVRHAVALVAGGLPERSEDPARPFNTAVAFDATGTQVARYRKIHLFDVDAGDGVRYRESAATSAGSEPVVAELVGLRVGLSVCYDLRFPELYRRLVDAEADLLTVPAAFTMVTGKDHWHVLLRARAIESQAYLLAAAQWGRHGPRQTYGKSCLVDGWGDVVAQASEGEGVVTGEVDLDYLADVRRRLPSLRHRRL